VSIERDLGEMIRKERGAIASAIARRHYEGRPAACDPSAGEGWEKSIRDVGYHLSYLVEALLAEDPALFVAYAQWAQVLFDNLGFPSHVMPATVEIMRDVLEQRIPPSAQPTIGTYLEASLAGLERHEEPESFLGQGGLHADLAERYLNALLQGDRQVASRLILDAVEGGVSVKAIYLDVFQPVQREIGRLWQMNRINVAEEHYSTAATQLIMSQLYPRIFVTERVGRRLVATCVGEELHEIGVRMVADFFEMAGWDTYYLGANVPSESIIQSAAEHEADLVAISATLMPHVSEVAALIERIRASEKLDDRVKILIGGYPFNLSAGLWERLGADGYAPDASQAVDVANELVEESHA